MNGFRSYGLALAAMSLITAGGVLAALSNPMMVDNRSGLPSYFGPLGFLIEMVGFAAAFFLFRERMKSDFVQNHVSTPRNVLHREDDGLIIVFPGAPIGDIVWRAISWPAFAPLPIVVLSALPVFMTVIEGKAFDFYGLAVTLAELSCASYWLLFLLMWVLFLPSAFSGAILRATAHDITIRNQWLVFSSSRRIPLAEIQEIRCETLGIAIISTSGARFFIQSNDKWAEDERLIGRFCEAVSIPMTIGRAKG